MRIPNLHRVYRTVTFVAAVFHITAQRGKEFGLCSVFCPDARKCSRFAQKAATCDTAERRLCRLRGHRRCNPRSQIVPAWRCMYGSFCETVQGASKLARRCFLCAEARIRVRKSSRAPLLTICGRLLFPGFASAKLGDNGMEQNTCDERTREHGTGRSLEEVRRRRP